MECMSPINFARFINEHSHSSLFAGVASANSLAVLVTKHALIFVFYGLNSTSDIGFKHQRLFN